MTASDHSNKIIQLDVGGTLYKVSRDTLERCKGSMLASLISGHWKEGISDNNEPIFIDRNGRLFEYVLDYLRGNKVYLPSSDSRADLKKEFEYYGIVADTDKVIEMYGREYSRDLKAKIDALQNEMDLLKAEKFVIWLAHFAESELLRSDFTKKSVSLDVPEAECAPILKYPDSLRDILLDLGLQFISIKQQGRFYTITVAEAANTSRAK